MKEATLATHSPSEATLKMSFISYSFSFVFILNIIGPNPIFGQMIFLNGNDII